MNNSFFVVCEHVDEMEKMMVIFSNFVFTQINGDRLVDFVDFVDLWSGKPI